MFAPTLGLAVPLSTPHPVVCGQFPSSHSPSMGRTAAVILCISSSPVNSPAHPSLTATANPSASTPTATLHPIPTLAASLALFGFPAPSSFPTLVDTPKLRDDGNMYISDVI
ncbi:hypothetical protein MLD38_025660 [Melastoma candidum]|uniref:Uncharacterized protein n=1 Tax=Melastoma candidum TaxID=119954 RepID=A0ACB9NYY4_9MYRT|nr:hypothetical protein MLD38_025660 [Melastoma candidum]